MWQQILNSAVAVATVVASVAALGTLTRGARLRRAEAQWRQILQTDTGHSLSEQQHRMVADLHRHAVARMVGDTLARSRRFVWLNWTGVLALPFGMGGTGWGMAQAVTENHAGDLGAYLDYYWWVVLLMWLVYTSGFAIPAGYLLRHRVLRYDAIEKILVGDSPPGVLPGRTAGVTVLRALILALIASVLSFSAGGYGWLLWWGRQGNQIPEDLFKVVTLGVSIGLTAVVAVLTWAVATQRPSAPPVQFSAIQPRPQATASESAETGDEPGSTERREHRSALNRKLTTAGWLLTTAALVSTLCMKTRRGHGRS